MSNSTSLTAEALWASSAEPLISATSAATFRAWLSPSRPVSLDRGTLTLAVPNDFVRSRIQSDLYDSVVSVLNEVLGEPVSLRLVVDPDLPPLADAPVATVRSDTENLTFAGVDEPVFVISEDGLTPGYLSLIHI